MSKKCNVFLVLLSTGILSLYFIDPIGRKSTIQQKLMRRALDPAPVAFINGVHGQISLMEILFILHFQSK